MSSFAEQLAARAAKRTAREGDSTATNPSLSSSSPTRRSGDKIITPSLKNGSSPSKGVNSLSEQIKSRAGESSDKGRANDVMMGKNIKTDGGDSTVTTDEISMSSSQQQPLNNNQTSPVRIQSSSRSRKDEYNQKSVSSSGASTAKASLSSKQKQQRYRADDSNNSPKRSDDNIINDDTTTSNPPIQPKSEPQTPTKMSSQPSEPAPTADQLSKLKVKLDRYKSESKKLRHENLLLKAKSEEMATLLGQLQKLETAHKTENEGLSLQVKELTEQIAKLEMTHGVTVENETSDESEWNGIQSSIQKLREDRPLKHPLDSDNSSDASGDVTKRDSMVAKTAKLAQIILDTEGNATGSFEEKDETISALNTKVSQMEEELAEVTELKNAEIDVLRKQLNRAEQQYNRNNYKDSNRPQDVATIEQQQEEWTKEREELREEIRRLNLEVSKQTMSNQLLDQEEEDDTARYNGTSSTSLFITSPKKLDDSDVSSLQSIIGMMRQTIDQCNKEKEELEQRLAEEQERSQNELKAFAKTLEGVDDLRKSAETMSREIRRIKVKGYRPTRSDLMGVSLGGNLDGVRNFGELTAAVEASESMEDAIRMIEGQNDALEERRRLGVVAASVSREQSATTANHVVPVVRKGGIGLRAISEDDDEGGFLSFWHGTGRNKEEDDDDDENATTKRDKKKKSKRKKKRDDEGSVFTSFF